MDKNDFTKRPLTMNLAPKQKRNVIKETLGQDKWSISINKGFMKLHTIIDKLIIKGSLIPKGSEAVFVPFLKFG